MLRMVWHELRRRLGRTLAMGFAVLVAAAGFTVLTSSSDASKLATIGTVKNAGSGVKYDVLVRPKGARTPQETSDRLIQPGFLSSLYGGITTVQWQQILHLSGVSVAAPMTVVGSVVTNAYPDIPVRRFLSPSTPTTFRVDGTWKLPDGTVQPQKAQYFYFAPTTTRNQSATPPAMCTFPPASQQLNQPSGLIVTQAPSGMTCNLSPAAPKFNGFSSNLTRAVNVSYPLPQVLVAVDPAQETKLLGLQDASPAGSLQRLSTLTTGSNGSAVVPVLYSNQPGAQTQLKVSITRLPTAAAAHLVATRGNALQPGALGTLRAPVVASKTLTAGDVVHSVQTKTRDSSYESSMAGRLGQYFTVSSPHLTGQGQDYTAVAVRNVLSQLWTLDGDAGIAPAGSGGVGFRRLTARANPQATPGPVLRNIGSFDPSKLAGMNKLAGQVLDGYAIAPTTPGDDTTRKQIGNGPVPASLNIASLVQPAPTVLTSLAALPALMNNTTTPGLDQRGPSGEGDISAIRVKVAGVTGVDAVSKERVRLVAQRIAAMGLNVDITVGSSPSQVTIHQPNTVPGKPDLVLHQWWAKLGVATTILKALDAKSLGLFILVLLVAGLCVANSAIASVRSRRTDLGVLACVGWTRAALFRLVVTELGAIALVAGVIAAGISLLLGAAFGTPVSPSRALLAIPASLVVTLVAGFVPAYLAARSDPMDAVRPAVTTPRTPRATRTLLGLGRGNLARSRTRTVLAVLGLVVATAAFTLLLAISVGFQGAVVGSVLGDAVAIQTRTSDYAAALATFALAGIGVGNLMYLNIRDRGPELATLRATGWTEHHLRQLLLTEGALIGAIGGITGATLGLAAALALIGSLPILVLVAAAATAIAAVAISLAATLLASTLLLRLPTALLLTE